MRWILYGSPGLGLLTQFGNLDGDDDGDQPGIPGVSLLGWSHAPHHARARRVINGAYVVPCACKRECGDVDENEDPDGVCKNLPEAAAVPLVEIVMVPR